MLKKRSGNQDAVICFQGLALILLIISTAVITVLPQISPTPSYLAGAIVLNGQEQDSGKTGLFLDGRKQLIAPLYFIAVQDSALAAAAPPLTVEPQVLGTLGGIFYQQPDPEVVRYVVQQGDTVELLAADFGITPETILWANELKSGAELVEGKELVILPVSGTLHAVRPYDTLSEIASWYKVSVEDIVNFNEIDSPEKIVVGDLLVIPGGIKPDRLPASRLAQVQGSFYPPTGTPYRITQGLHYFNAIDFGADCGDPVYAAASGTVQRTGYDSIGGNYIRILHPSGVVTYYGHLSAFGVTRGQQVNQGQRIGSVGRTGYATGCHTHFEVRGTANPFAK